MKKTLALALAVVMSLGLLAGCGDKETKDPANNGGRSNGGSSQSQQGGGSDASEPTIPEGGTVGVCIYKFDPH